MAKNILIATFSLRINGQRTAINGMIEPLLSFFLPKNYAIDLIDGYHPGSNDTISVIEQYNKDKLIKKSKSFISILLSPILRLQNNNSTQTIFKIRDLLAVFEWAIRAKKRYDIYIGLESIYTIAGIMLKRLGIVKKVIYYVSDYSPNRYSNKLFNDVYLTLDRFCAKNADYIWDVSPAMQPARISTGLNPKESAPVILVPNALFENQISPVPLSEIIPFSLVYAGTLTKGNGPDIAVKAMRYILKKFPKSSLHIFGSNGADQARIKILIQKYSLGKSVIFHGFIAQVADITNAIHTYSIGLAPYLNIPGSHRKYGDATKLRLYMGAGIPVITTPVPPLGKEVEKFGAGLIIKDDPKSLANLIVELFNNKNRYITLREKAIEYSKNNTWENMYSSAFSRMEIEL